MTAKRIRTTYTFGPHEGRARAECFRRWLEFNVNDRDYGHPRFVDLRHVSPNETCVEYEHDARCEVARGVAIGVDLADVV